MPSRPLYIQQSATLDANGFASIRFQPVSGQTWNITAVTVNVSTAVVEATSKNYIGFVGDAYMVDGTFTGSSGDTTDTPTELQDGQAFIVEWYGGDVGSTANVTIRGTINFPENNGFVAR